MAYPGYGGGHPGHPGGYWGPQGGYDGYGYQSRPPPPPPPQGRPQWLDRSFGPEQHQHHFSSPSDFGPPPGHHQYMTPPPPQFYPSPSPGFDPYGHTAHQGSPHPQGYYGEGGHAAPVPNAPQQFGRGAPSDYTFQYSDCSGSRKALLIGINYYGQKNELRGCINDTKNLSEFLIESYNYKRDDMVILTDDQADPVRQPTKANIIRAMQWLVAGARPNDSLFLHFSGHGGQTEDLDGDEDDGYDEVIYPVDYQVAGHIVDDDIHDICVKPLTQGVRLTAVFDSCHSGTVMDLPYIYSTKGALKEPNLASEAAQGALSAFSAYTRGDIGSVVSSVMEFANKAMRGDEARQGALQTKTSPADVIMFSGSKDNQTSADAMIAQQATGAMSWAFITALKENPQQSYVQLLNSIRNVLATKYTQKPQLSCSHPLDTNILFVM